ncbi:MAG TPA: TM0106 family RecB-like putative nuclease [Fervidobacterium sp.]|nr:recombinase RecB [Fervidobacterium sp.]HOQ39192.1 TM0106 family RecB-like putative nuclease [Fervidobacterium sp.]HPT53814.1 TM0106 family RecB-like putative nuclease [Fervidobacterium sp.]HRD20109.1 TM0106 family RecB-like putative nuclease [Fervidobacterium sp.]
MTISNRDIKTIYICPKKGKLDIESSNENGTKKEFSTDAFGCELVIEPSEVLSTYPMVVKIHKTGKKLAEYDMLEGAFVGYVLESAGYEIGDILFESSYYSISLNWRGYVTKMLSFLSAFCESCANGEFSIMKNYLCRTCKYSADCFRETLQGDNITFVRGIKGKTFQRLHELGVDSLCDIVSMHDVLEKEFGKGKADKIFYQAKSILENRCIPFRPLPKLNDGIYLDIESYTPIDFDYLFGLLDDNTYVPFLARNLVEEKETFKSTIAYLMSTNKPIYHYHSYELVRFRKLSKKYNINLPNNLFGRFTDVYKIYSEYVALPLPSYSLKAIARYFGFNWRTNLNGLVVIDSYKDYIGTNDENVLSEILRYNEDDVRATAFLVERINQMREMMSVKDSFV